MIQRLTITFTTVFLLTACFSYGQTKTSVKEQAQKFITKLKSNGDYPIGGNDTLIDLNGDNFKDVLVEYYGSAGTGLKNRISVYLYDKSKKKFTTCKQLNSLANPTFYFTKKVVAGYYIAGSGGHATKLKWNGLKLDTLEYIDVDLSWQGNNLTCKLVAHDYTTRKTTSSLFDHVSLPKEYHYGDYKPLIKTNSR